jgi:subtilase family serine protease
VCNQGTAFAPGAQVELFGSFDPAFDLPGMFGGGDFPMGSAWANGLQPGACENVALNGFQPPIDGEGFVFARVDGSESVPELVESNNVFAQGVVGVGSYPDLVIRRITTPPSTNGAFTATFRVCNEGVAPASMVMMEIYASRDGDLEVPMGPGGDFFLGTTQSPSFLLEGRCDTVSFQGFMPPFQGEGFVIARLDPFEGLVEAIESNNVAVSDGIGFGSGPDLVVRAVDAPTAIEPSRAVTVTVCNDGTDFAPSTDVELFASRDATLDVPPGMAGTPGGDMSVGFAPVVGLAPGACTTASAQIWGAPFMGEGHLIAEVDRRGTIVELRESNNLRASRVLGFGYGPEVLATTITAPPSASGAFTARVRVCNEGNQSTGSVQVELFASRDRVFDGMGPGGDAFVGSNVGTWLAEGACETVEIAGFAPPWMGEGSLFARVDGGNGIAELIESNNVTAGPQMGFGFGPDLVVEAILAPASIGSSARVEARVCNRGTAPASSTQLELYASADTELTTLGPGDFFIGSTSVDFLQEGRCRTIGVDTWAPPLQGEGYLFARVDPYAGVSELIESNNERMSGVIGFGSGPVARAVLTPTAIGPSGGVVTVEVCNQGTQPAPNAQIQVFGSTDTRLDGTPPPAGDFFLGSATTNSSLDVGRCARVSVNVPSVPLQGEGFVLAQVDPSNTIAELVESNNVTASARLGFGNGPDLAVTSIQAPPSAGSGFSAIVTVCNQGTAPAPGTEVQLIASRDTTFDASQPPAGDLPIGFGQSPPLDAGACAAVTLSAWSGFPGANYLFGRVDAFGAVAELVES